MKALLFCQKSDDRSCPANSARDTIAVAEQWWRASVWLLAFVAVHSFRLTRGARSCKMLADAHMPKNMGDKHMFSGLAQGESVLKKPVQCEIKGKTFQGGTYAVLPAMPFRG